VVRVILQGNHEGWPFYFLSKTITSGNGCTTGEQAKYIDVSAPFSGERAMKGMITLTIFIIGIFSTPTIVSQANLLIG